MTYWAEGMMQVYIPRPKYFSRHGHKFHLYVPRHYSDSLSYHQPEVIGLVPDSDDLQVIPEHDVVIPEHDVVMHTRYSYRWQVLRLSDDFFHFTQSRYLQRTNPLSFIGLAPAMSAWSNVSGGFGVVAGCRVTEIPWQESRRPAGLLNTR